MYTCMLYKREGKKERFFLYQNVRKSATMPYSVPVLIEAGFCLYQLVTGKSSEAHNMEK